MAGLVVKGVTTSLSYVNLVFGDTVLIPARSPVPVGNTVSAPTIDPISGVATLPEVIVTGDKTLDISDINGNLLISLGRSNSDGFGSLTLYRKDPVTGKTVTVDLAPGQTQQYQPFLAAEVNDAAGVKLGSLTQSQLPSGKQEIVFAGANDVPTQTTIAQIFLDGTTLRGSERVRSCKIAFMYES